MCRLGDKPQLKKGDVSVPRTEDKKAAMAAQPNNSAMAAEKSNMRTSGHQALLPADSASSTNQGERRINSGPC